MTRKRKKLIQGDKILMFREPRKRGPVRIDRSVPIHFEEYQQQRDERLLETARVELSATTLRSAEAPSATTNTTPAPRTSDGETP